MCVSLDCDFIGISPWVYFLQISAFKWHNKWITFFVYFWNFSKSPISLDCDDNPKFLNEIKVEFKKVFLKKSICTNAITKNNESLSLKFPGFLRDPSGIHPVSFRYPSEILPWSMKDGSRKDSGEIQEILMKVTQFPRFIWKSNFEHRSSIHIQLLHRQLKLHSENRKPVYRHQALPGAYSSCWSYLRVGQLAIFNY